MLTRATSRVIGRGAARQTTGHEPGRGGDPVGSPVWPLAVGVLIVPPDFTGRTRAEDRLALALGAYRLGYYLLDLIDVPAWHAPDGAGAWTPVWGLAKRAAVDAVVVHRPGPQGLYRIPTAPPGMERLAIRVLRADS
jgi:hypothetical protein